jgi:hypothetical protein
VPGGRILIAAAAAALTLPLTVSPSASAATAPSVLVRASSAGAADALGAGAVPALPPASVARLERRAGRPLPELRGLYRLRAGGTAHARRLARALDARAGVAAALDPAPAPPPATCRAAPEEGWPVLGPGPTPDLMPLQDYREGLDVPEGADGAGVRIADVEYEWRRTHEELAGRRLAAPVLSPGGLDPGFLAEEHGTAVLGVLAGDDDGEGVTGLAPDAAVVPLSPFFPARPALFDLLGAILEASGRLRAGDVLLIEQQVDLAPPGAPRALAPVEAVPEIRRLIRAIVDAGIVVVEPAGNGGVDLAGLRRPWLADPADPGHSGALIVGAGHSALTGDDLARAAGSNFGARVDLQGYGAGVVTSGYGEALGAGREPDRNYTSCFDGTSSAAATVAGAVAALQGLARAAGAPLTPEAVRAALVGTGARPAEPTDEPIGPRPQVAQAAALIDVAPPPPAGGGGVAEPVEPPAPPVAPAPPPAALQPATRPAARRALGRLDRRAGTLTITLRGLAPRVVAFVGKRRVRVARGRIVLAGARPRRFVLVVGAAPRPGVAVVAARFLVTVRAHGPVRVERL